MVRAVILGAACCAVLCAGWQLASADSVLCPRNEDSTEAQEGLVGVESMDFSTTTTFLRLRPAGLSSILGRDIEFHLDPLYTSSLTTPHIAALTGFARSIADSL